MNAPTLASIQPILNYFNDHEIVVNTPPLQTEYNIHIQKEQLLRYNIDEQKVIATLKTIFNQHQIGTLQTNTEAIPIRTGQNEKGFYNLLQNINIKNRNQQPIPLFSLIKISPQSSYKYITGDKSGEIINLDLDQYDEKIIEDLTSIAQKQNDIRVEFSGQFFESQANIRQLWQIAGIAIGLLFLILAAQFESIVQPFIILLTVPIGIGGSLFLLYFTNQSLNLMAMIGMVVMSGIVVNDAILKVDMINRLSKELSLIEAIHQAGKRRLKPILMTSITTILALLPILFTSGLGAELQFPLAIAVIGGLTVGTLASLYIIPIFYQLLKR